MALQLRYLQTMREMSAEQNSTVIFPFPMDLFRPLLKLMGNGESRDQGSVIRSQGRSESRFWAGEKVGGIAGEDGLYSGSPYKTVRVNNFNKLHIMAFGSTWEKLRCLQSKTGRYFQTCIAL